MLCFADTSDNSQNGDFHHTHTLTYTKQLPQTKGAKFLYDSFLKDFLKKNESKIDVALADAKKSAGAVAADVASSFQEGVDTVSGKETKKET